MTPEFRYFMLINETKTENNGIFPVLRDSDGKRLWDGSTKDRATSVPAGTNGAQSVTYDLNDFKLAGVVSATPLILGGSMKDSILPASDSQNKWNYSGESTNTVYGIYHDDQKTFTVYPPPSKVGEDAVALQSLPSINVPAMGKLLVAIGSLGFSET